MQKTYTPATSQASSLPTVEAVEAANSQAHHQIITITEAEAASPVTQHLHSLLATLHQHIHSQKTYTPATSQASSHLPAVEAVEAANSQAHHQIITNTAVEAASPATQH